MDNTENMNNPSANTENGAADSNGGNNTQVKTFTQEEVNRIVNDRLARANAHNAAVNNHNSCVSFMKEMNFPDEESKIILDALDTSDAGQFKKTVNALLACYDKRKVTMHFGQVVQNPPKNVGNMPDLRSAFNLDNDKTK